MESIDFDLLPHPQELIAALGTENSFGISLLQRTHILVTIFQCKFFDTGAGWDVGFCLGYTIYAAPGDMFLLKYCEATLSKLGNRLASKYYGENDLRPYGMVLVLPHTELSQLCLPDQIVFLKCCLK